MGRTFRRDRNSRSRKIAYKRNRKRKSTGRFSDRDEPKEENHKWEEENHGGDNYFEKFSQRRGK